MDHPAAASSLRQGIGAGPVLGLLRGPAFVRERLDGRGDYYSLYTILPHLLPQECGLRELSLSQELFGLVC